MSIDSPHFSCIIDCLQLLRESFESVNRCRLEVCDISFRALLLCQMRFLHLSAIRNFYLFIFFFEMNNKDVMNNKDHISILVSYYFALSFF